QCTVRIPGSKPANSASIASAVASGDALPLAAAFGATRFLSVQSSINSILASPSPDGRRLLPPPSHDHTLSRRRHARGGIHQRQESRMDAEGDGQARPKKRALCLAGGGPAAGFHIGALAAFEACGLTFDVWSLSCIGAWVGIYYNQVQPK